MANKNRIWVSDVITRTEIAKWREGEIITISANTGDGKSYFIKNTLYEWARERGQKILMLVSRKNTKDQFFHELQAAGKTNVIHVALYQSIDKLGLYRGINGVDLSNYAWVVCDEFHYWLADANFNRSTDISFYTIMNQKNSIRILMSATGEDINTYVHEITGYIARNYSIPRNCERIESVSFFYKESAFDYLLKTFSKRGEKALVFIDRAEEAYRYYQKYKDKSLFVVSSGNKKYAPRMNQEAVDTMLQKEKFDCQFVFTTTCLDAGINIKDPDLHNIIASVRDVGSLIQCCGRKRMIAPNDTVRLYIHALTNCQLGGMISRINKDIEMALYRQTHTNGEYLDHFQRNSIDYCGIVYPEKDKEDDNKAVYLVNELMLRKRQNTIEDYKEMLKCHDKYGYCPFVRDKLGVSSYSVIKDEDAIEKYLSSMLGKVMYKKADRKELIERLNVRRDRKLKRSLDILNAALAEDECNYRIEEFRTHAVIDGKRKQFNNAWRVVLVG